MAPAYTPTKQEMARQVKAARLKRKLSIDQAAALVGTSRQQWIRWEKAENMPTDYAEALARLLDLRPDLFVEEEAPAGDPFRGERDGSRGGAARPRKATKGKPSARPAGDLAA